MDSITRNQVTAAQVQHLEDAARNPLTGQFWASGHDEILSSRRRLPVYGRYQEILDNYHQSQVIVILSETGTGKSTQVPQLLIYDEYSSGLPIACTQPRRLAATQLAGRVAKEMGVVLGEEVGYKIRGERMADKNQKKTRLVYLTEGVLLQQLISDRNLSEYACVVLDEAHERTADLDLLMELLKKAVGRRRDLKVVIMSATMDATRFQEYFDNCPLVHISGRNFHVENYYVAHDDTPVNFVVAAVRFVMHVHEKNKPGNILVFLPGQAEIEHVCNLLRRNTENLDIFPLYSALPADSQRLALTHSSPNRKCIVSTNIAETSLTIDNVVFVIDTGLSRQLIYNPRIDMHMLELRPISQASAKQRAGRAGRTRDGVCYRLYSKKTYDSLDLSTTPAIRSVSVDSLLLKLIAAGYRKPIDFDRIDAPHPESIARAAQDLRDWVLIKEDGSFTPSGRLAAKCPVDPIWYRAIEVGAKLGCCMEMVDIALLCSSQASIFLRPAQYQQAADHLMKSFQHSLSDHLTLANAFNAYMQVRQLHQQEGGLKFDLAEWCSRFFLNIQALEAVYLQRQELGSFMESQAKFAPTHASVQDMTCVRKALAIAFCTHTAIHHSGDVYRTVHENTSALLAPLSSLVGGDYEWIVYTTLRTSGGKQYLQTATAINAEWLVDLPFFQEARMPTKGNGPLRQPQVKRSLDDAKARNRTAQGQLAP